MEFSLSIESLLERVSVVAAVGETDISHVTGIATLDAAIRGDLSFASSGRRRQALAASAASVVIVPEGFDVEPKPGHLFLQAKNPSLELAKVCELIAARRFPKPPPGIHATACVSPDARVDASASVGPFVVVDAGADIAGGCVVESHCRIESDARLGEDCWLSSNVAIGRATVLGRRVRIHPGSVLGADGFGYEFEDGRHRKVPQIGNVVVGDDVEIGACTTIDRGRLGPTTIGEGTKIDNQVQIGHNVAIGKHCILCSQVGIAGSVSIGDYVVFGGKSGSSGHVSIESGVQVAGGAYVFSDTPAKSKLGGAPAIPLMAHQRITLLTRRLPELFKRLKRLEDELLAE